MVILPILYQEKIYHLEIKLKNIYDSGKVSNLKLGYENNVFVNGQDYNSSIYHVKNAPFHNVVDFIRAHSSSCSSFEVFSKKNEQGEAVGYQVALPYSHVAEGLDLLYGSVILNMKRDILGNEKDRYISLGKLGVLDYITDEEWKLLREKRMEENRLHELMRFLGFFQQFECHMVLGSTVDEKVVQTLVSSMENMNTDTTREMKKYYQIAKENRKEYTKLEYLSQVLTGESFGWLQETQNLIKVKSRGDIYGK